MRKKANSKDAPPVLTKTNKGKPPVTNVPPANINLMMMDTDFVTDAEWAHILIVREIPLVKHARPALTKTSRGKPLANPARRENINLILADTDIAMIAKPIRIMTLQGTALASRARQGLRLIPIIPLVSKQFILKKIPARNAGIF